MFDTLINLGIGAIVIKVLDLVGQKLDLWGRKQEKKVVDETMISERLLDANQQTYSTMVDRLRALEEENEVIQDANINLRLQDLQFRFLLGLGRTEDVPDTREALLKLWIERGILPPPPSL